MKIAFDHQTFNWQSYGGISRYYAILAQELLNNGQDVNIFAGIHCNNYLSTLPSNIVKGIKLNKYPPKTGRFFQSVNQCLTNRQINNWKPDIVHETYYSFMPSFKRALPRITTVYDMIHEIYSKNFSTRDKTTHWKKKTLGRVDHIISISHSTKNDLIDIFGIEENKISVIHLGVDLDFSCCPSGFNTKPSRPFLLYVGARGGYKNFHAVLQALSNSSQLKKDFDLVAFGGGKFTRDELNLISSLGFQGNNIQHIGGGDDKLKELYYLASAFIYPSLYEGFGMPPLEAMACSCPVISSNSSSMPEVIGLAGEYFDPTSFDELMNAVKNVVYSSTRADELRLLGKERIGLFSWEMTAKHTLDVYRKVVG